MVGILLFYGEQRKVLLKAICHNLAKSKEKYLTSENHQQLQSKMVDVEEKPFPTLLDALIYFKSLPEGQTKQHSQYRYLCLDPVGVPCLATVSSTIARGKHFVGPFRNLFFVSDFTDRFSEKFSLPTLGEEREFSQILDFYLNEKIWEDCQQKIDQLEGDLKFAQAQNLKEQFASFGKYFEWLKFIQKSKTLSFSCSWQGQELVVQDGLLLSYGDLRLRLDYQPMEYQESEKYAVPLDELDEREIIYQFFLKSVD